MKKRILSLALAAMLLLSLAACGGQTNDTPGGTQTPGTQQTPPAGTQTQQPAQTQEPPAESQTPAAPAATNRPLEEMSMEERVVLETITYGYLMEMVNTGGDPGAIAEMTSEAFIRYFFQNTNLSYGSGEANKGAVTELVLNHAGDFAKLVTGADYDTIMNTIVNEPQNVPFPGGWDAWYREYETIKARIEAEIAVIDTAAEAFPAIQFTGDSMIYKENGVEFYYTGCTVEGGEVRFQFHVSNQNPDNKKVFIAFSSLSVNGLEFASTATFGVNKNNTYNSAINNGLTVGEETDIICTGRSPADYELLLSRLGETVVTMPIETVTIGCSIKVGSNSEAEEKTVEFKTTLYHEGDLDGLFGTYVGSVSDRGQNVDIYAKHGEFGITAVAVNTGDQACSDFLYANINGKRDNGLNQIHHRVGMLMGTTIVSPNGAEIVFYTDVTDEQLRKENEIGNSELLEISIDYCGANVVIYSK